MLDLSDHENQRVKSQVKRCPRDMVSGNFLYKSCVKGNQCPEFIKGRPVTEELAVVAKGDKVAHWKLQRKLLDLNFCTHLVCTFRSSRLILDSNGRKIIPKIRQSDAFHGAILNHNSATLES